MARFQYGGEHGDVAGPVMKRFERVYVGGREAFRRALRLGGVIACGREIEAGAAGEAGGRVVLMGKEAPKREERGGDEDGENEKRFAHSLGPLPVPPPLRGREDAHEQLFW